MNNNKTGLAIFLSILIILVYTELVIKPQDQEIQKQQTTVAASSTTPAVSENPNETTVTPANEIKTSRADYLDGATTEIDTEKFTMKLSHRGARIIM